MTPCWWLSKVRQEELPLHAHLHPISIQWRQSRFETSFSFLTFSWHFLWKIREWCNFRLVRHFEECSLGVCYIQVGLFIHKFFKSCIPKAKFTNDHPNTILLVMRILGDHLFVRLGQQLSKTSKKQKRKKKGEKHQWTCLAPSRNTKKIKMVFKCEVELVGLCGRHFNYCLTI
jgi:hypothetical protein